MGYRELLQALEEEVDRQIRELRAEASQEHQRLLETTRLEMAARREKVLEEEQRRLQEGSARALSGARLEQEHAILGEMRRQMAELQREAEARLPAMNDRDLLTRLVDEGGPGGGKGGGDKEGRAGPRLSVSLPRRGEGKSGGSMKVGAVPASAFPSPDVGR